MKQKFHSSFLRLLLFVPLIAMLAFGCSTNSADASTNDSAHKDSVVIEEKTVRGVTYASFLSMTQVDPPLDTLLPAMWELWQAENWNVLDTLITTKKISGGYPPAYGFINVDTITLPVDKLLDRYGSLYGNFVSDDGASYGGRSLSPGSENKAYYKFKVIKPIPVVLAGKAIPWFGQPGMDVQYMFTNKINVLIANNYLIVTDSVPAKPAK